MRVRLPVVRITFSKMTFEGNDQYKDYDDEEEEEEEEEIDEKEGKILEK